MVSCRWMAAVAAALSLAGTGIAGCGGDDDSGMPTVEVWFHGGQGAERDALLSQVERFNQRETEFQVELVILPEGSYNDQVQAAALDDTLPDLLDFDGPFLYNYVWQQKLQPLDEYVTPELERNLLPSIIAQGTFGDGLYALGTFDSGLGVWGNRRLLEAAGITEPPESPDEAWTVEEFAAVLEALAGEDSDGRVLDVKLNYAGEWASYAFSPILQSAGADLIDRTDYQQSDGVLNSPDAVEAMTTFQDWLSEFVDPNTADDAFISGEVALSWVGHWEYGRYSEALGDDLVLLPLPDFGMGTKTGQGSWNWGITAQAEHPDLAWEFLEFLLTDDEVLAMADANGAVPATLSAVEQSELYAEGGPLELFSQQLADSCGDDVGPGCVAVPRPITAAYPVISSEFSAAFEDIVSGADVESELDAAAEEIDIDISDNQGYPIIT